ncbi:hypothetical protein FEM33_15105 [Dyadobacter flavalbus]|uniref:Class I lanthipeptide n=1 Tax=Dyadobacter flavalbus TaxID=2579942 RepID=A0A5M8QRL3_9BACT|nr:class I lanthipeptide [Dyadobacter flavalbus]KAA6438897.1 hypothetical protein FEM33_15105 [Dyadobacter flavalbus]
MKKKSTTSKLSIDKETIARLNLEQLSEEQAQEVEGGVTGFTAPGQSCCAGSNGTYTSCC